MFLNGKACCQRLTVNGFGERIERIGAFDDYSSVRKLWYNGQLKAMTETSRWP